MYLRFLLFFTLFLFASFKVETSRSPVDSESTLNYVIDNEGIFAPHEAKKLERIIAKHERETSNEIVILTTPDHGDLPSLRDYALHYFNKRGIGKGDKDNGVLIAMEKEKRRIEIVNGYGILDILTNKQTQKIIDDVIVPSFKKEKYFRGLKKGLKEIINEIQ